MKALAAIALLLLSLNALSAQVQDCKYGSTTLKNVVVLNDAGAESIQKILDTKKSLEEKKDLIKRVLYIETVSIGDGKSVCELATKQYNVSEEKCMRVMKSSDLLSVILEDASDIDLSLNCRIGAEAGIQMGFNM